MQQLESYCLKKIGLPPRILALGARTSLGTGCDDVLASLAALAHPSDFLLEAKSLSGRSDSILV